MESDERQVKWEIASLKYDIGFALRRTRGTSVWPVCVCFLSLYLYAQVCICTK